MNGMFLAEARDRIILCLTTSGQMRGRQMINATVGKGHA